MWWIIGIGVPVLATVFFLLFVYGGTHPGKEEADARDDYLSFKKYLEDNITSGCPVIKEQNEQE